MKSDTIDDTASGATTAQAVGSAVIPAPAAEVVHSEPQLAIKRGFDVVFALIALVVALPFMLLVAILVKATSNGPVFFRQERVGRGGRLFTVLKFRTMFDGTDKLVHESDAEREVYEANDFKLQPDHPQITKLGRLLRATSLDELPQFLNVLAGHMSVVGVRPVLERELAKRPQVQQDCYRAMRPGITGLWQVAGRSSVPATDRRKLERDYVENWTLWQDTKILAKTPFAVLQFHRSH